MTYDISPAIIRAEREKAEIESRAWGRMEDQIGTLREQLSLMKIDMKQHQAYITRLEAEYLQLYRECTDGSGPDCDAIKGRMARESLERIKAGGQG